MLNVFMVQAIAAAAKNTETAAWDEEAASDAPDPSARTLHSVDLCWSIVTTCSALVLPFPISKFKNLQ